MGLDILVGNKGFASWSYSGFNDFRTRLARVIGITLNDMSGFGFLAEKAGKQSKNIDWSEVDDPIVPLLDHSDCEGELDPKTCAKVAPRLRELLDKMDSDTTEERYDREQGLLLVEAMKQAAKTKKPLKFC
jgi:hypothetical protein